MESKTYRASLYFSWGYLEDGSIWVQPPSNNIFSIDYNTLMAVYDLNGGVSTYAVSRKYGVTEEGVLALVKRFKSEGAIVSPCCGRITFEPTKDDTSLAAYLLVFLALIFIQLEYFQTYAKTFFVHNWYEVLALTVIAIIVIFFHELGHYFFAIRFFKKRPKISVGFSFIFPMVYVETHEAWRLPRNRRLLINSAGLFGDCVVNAAAICLAINSPGLERFVTPLLLTQYTRLSLILNPLFPTDGYWILADLTRTVNLGETASASLRKLRPNLYTLYAMLSLGFAVFSAAGLGWYLINIFWWVFKKFNLTF